MLFHETRLVSGAGLSHPQPLADILQLGLGISDQGHFPGRMSVLVVRYPLHRIMHSILASWLQSKASIARLQEAGPRLASKSRAQLSVELDL